MAVGCSITRIKFNIEVGQIYAASIALDWINAQVKTLLISHRNILVALAELTPLNISMLD
jgi:hypothetical protein